MPIVVPIRCASTPASKAGELIGARRDSRSASAGVVSLRGSWRCCCSRWSASLRASPGNSVSCGMTTLPCQARIMKPSPSSTSAAAACSMTGPASSSEPRNRTANSSPCVR